MTSSDKWQPIETAPRDGTDVLVACRDEVVSAAWIAKRIGWEFEGWHVYDGHEVYLLQGNNPTHWMPLPAPPDADA